MLPLYARTVDDLPAEVGPMASKHYRASSQY